MGDIIYMVKQVLMLQQLRDICGKLWDICGEL